MTFEVGDKVKTITGLYMNGGWREGGLKGKVIESPNEYGSLTVKFKGMPEKRYLHPDYLVLRGKKEEKAEAVQEETQVAGVYTGRFAEDESLILPGATVLVLDHSVPVDEDDWDHSLELTEGIIQSVDTEARTIVAELTDEGEEESYTETLGFDDFTVVEPAPAENSPEVQESLDLILARIEEIVDLLKAGPRHEFVVNVNASDASFVTPEEEPEPEPVFKKAKEVKEGDSLYTEAGVWDKVGRIETKDSGYTSLYGAFGNKIVQVPSGRMVQVLEPAS